MKEGRHNLQPWFVRQNHNLPPLSPTSSTACELFLLLGTCMECCLAAFPAFPGNTGCRASVRPPTIRHFRVSKTHHELSQAGFTRVSQSSGRRCVQKAAFGLAKQFVGFSCDKLTSWLDKCQVGQIQIYYSCCPGFFPHLSGFYWRPNNECFPGHTFCRGLSETCIGTTNGTC